MSNPQPESTGSNLAPQQEQHTVVQEHGQQHGQQPVPRTEDAAMLRTLAEGRTLMAQKDYIGALTKAVEATRLCPCGTATKHHPRDKSCHIREVVQIVQWLRPDKLRRPECQCGFVWPACTRPAHVDAVDLQAECSVKADRHAAAYSIALSLIRLDPESAAGYCRAVAIMRHLVRAQLDVQAPETRALKVLVQTTGSGSVDAFADLIRPFISCGLLGANGHRHQQDIKYIAILRKMAHHMGMNEAKVDPVRMLPPEVLSIIFSHMDLSTLLRCMRVNKTWHGLILSDHMLWREVRLKKPGNPKNHFAKFINERRSIRILVLEEIAEFSLVFIKMNILIRGLPWLRRLHLGTTMSRPDRFKASLGGLSGNYLTMLTHLRLWGIGLPLMRDLIKLTSSTLESIDLQDTDCDPMSILPSCLPRLKRLRSRSTLQMPTIDIGLIACRTPNLQHLYLDGCHIPFFSDSDEFGVWDDLRTLVIGPRTNAIPYDASLRHNGLVPVPLFSSKIESLTVLSLDHHLPFLFLFPIPSGSGILRRPSRPAPLPSPLPTREQSYPNLRVFRCHSTAPPSLLEWALAPSLANKTLEVLELAHDPTSLTYNPIDHTATTGAAFGAPSRDPSVEYPFFGDACESVRTLGFHGFNFAPIGDAMGFGFAPVLSFLEKFPNVDTVAVYPGAHSVWVLVMELIETGLVKKVFQDRLQGVDWTSMQELARRKGVEVVHVPKHMPMEWDLEGW